MNLSKRLRILVVFLMGLAVGVGLCLLAGAVLLHLEPDTLGTRKKTFGDIEIWVQNTSIEKGKEQQGIRKPPAKVLWMAKKDIPFLMISQNELGEIDGFYVTKGEYTPVFDMKPVNGSGSWKHAMYTGETGIGYPTGYVYVDIDFNGHFDVKLVLDDNGKKVSKFVYIDRNWKKVDALNATTGMAVSDGKQYLFSDEKGWYEEN